MQVQEINDKDAYELMRIDLDESLGRSQTPPAKPVA
jgi:hypothetical protein